MSESSRGSMPVWQLVLVAVIVLGAGGLGLFFAPEGRGGGGANTETAQTTTIGVPVEGMSCVVCAASVKKALKSIDGVQEAEVSLERREARVRYVEGKVSPEQLVAAVNQLGYKAGTPVLQVP